jgi:hypothetical protein
LHRGLVGMDVGMVGELYHHMDDKSCLIHSPRIHIRMSSHCTRILVHYGFFFGYA